MEQEHRALLKNNHVFLVKELDLRNANLFWAKLLQNDIITDDMQDTIKSKITRTGITSEFLRIIQMRGPFAFQSFIDALKEQEGLDHIIDKLQPPNNHRS